MNSDQQHIHDDNSWALTSSTEIRCRPLSSSGKQKLHFPTFQPFELSRGVATILLLFPFTIYSFIKCIVFIFFGYMLGTIFVLLNLQPHLK